MGLDQQVKIKGYYVQIRRRGLDVQIRIGKKFLGSFVGKTFTLSPPGAREAKEILRLGMGAIATGKDTLYVSQLGDATILTIAGRDASISLTKAEVSALVAAVTVVLDDPVQPPSCVKG